MSIDNIAANVNKPLEIANEGVQACIDDVSNVFNNISASVTAVAKKIYEFIKENWGTILLVGSSLLALATMSWVMIPSDLLMLAFGGAVACIAQVFTNIVKGNSEDYHNIAKAGIALATISCTLIGSPTGALLTSLIGFGYIGTQKLLNIIDR